MMRNPGGPESLGSPGPEQLALEKGQEVARLYEGIWEQLPPVLRNYLVDSNVVLTVGGVKPLTEFFPGVPQDGDVVALQAGIDTLNEFLEQQNIDVRFEMVGKPFFAPNNLGLPRSQMVAVRSLAGYDKITHQTKTPGVLPFNQVDGWEGLDQWRSRYSHDLKAAQDRGELPQELDLGIVAAGILRGYPDIAIIDFAQYIAEGRTRPIVKMQVPHTGTYKEAEPNYDIFPEHADHPTVLENARELGALLQGFYESDFHQKISQEPEIAARRVKPKSS